MQQIEPITIINVDEIPHAVSEMSVDVKRLVDFYNDWRQEESDAKSVLLKVQAAMRDLSREIVMTIKQEADARQAADDAAATVAADAVAKTAADLEAAEKAISEVKNEAVVKDIKKAKKKDAKKA